MSYFRACYSDSIKNETHCMLTYIDSSFEIPKGGRRGYIKYSNIRKTFQPERFYPGAAFANTD